MWDLLLAGGEVIDPGGGHSGRLDVAVSRGRIAAVGPLLSPRLAREVVDVSGLLVTPGLVDMHTHVYAGSTYWGIEPDPVAWYSGVTTWVDAGSAGAYTLDGLRAAAGHTVRTVALLNIAAEGLVAPTGEDGYSVDLATAAVLANRDLVAGLKVRMDKATGGRYGLDPLRQALEVGRACDVPVMVHIGPSPPDIDEILPLLRPGDIVTHCASGLASGGTGALSEAYAAGVLFDLGHGSGSFSFEVLDAQLSAGLVPHIVSTDLNARSLYGPVFDLPTTMAKLLAAGLPLDRVVEASTVAPARALGLPAGTLGVGAPADIAVFEERPGEVELVDAHLHRRRLGYRLVNRATYVAGRPLPPRIPAAPAPWVPVTPAQREALSARTDRIRDLLATPLVSADGLDEQFPRP